MPSLVLISVYEERNSAQLLQHSSYTAPYSSSYPITASLVLMTIYEQRKRPAVLALVK